MGRATQPSVRDLMVVRTYYRPHHNMWLAYGKPYYFDTWNAAEVWCEVSKFNYQLRVWTTIGGPNSSTLYEIPWRRDAHE